MEIYRILLEQEAIRGERTAWIFRWVLYGLVLCLAAVVYFVGGKIVGLFGMLLSIGPLLYNTILTWFINRKRNFVWIRFISVTLDVLGLTLYNTLDTIFTSTLVPVTTAALLLYPVVLFLASLRLDRGLIIYATVFSTLCMNLLYFFAYPHFDPQLASQIVSANILGQVYRTIYVVLCGLLMLFVPGTITRLLKNQQDLHNKSRVHYEMANRDNLTGLANRRRLEDFLPGELALVKAEGRNLGVIYLDLDGFKPINDQFGHDTGDQVLQEIGRRLATTVRGSDLAVRMGGDEFVVILSRVENLDNCHHLAQRIKQQLELEIIINGRNLGVGVSYGLAIFPQDGENPDDLIDFADKAMLAQKKDRR